MEWREQYTKQVKPTYGDLLEFLPVDIREFFIIFNQAMEHNYKVYNKNQRYEKSNGWVYGYCRNYQCELLSVTIKNDCFCTLGIDVKDKQSLDNALLEVKKAYELDYEERYEAVVAKRLESQIKRTKLRLEREKAEMEKIGEQIDSNKLNKFRWSKKTSRKSLQKLYDEDAKGIRDEDLLDEVGFSFYARCKQGKEVRDYLESGKLICHHCETVLSVVNYTDLVHCPCGYGYTYREYRRSFYANNLPAGRAIPIFDTFLVKWQDCRSYNDKMQLIDWLIHQCHVSLMSGAHGRSVCVNLIEGTKKQITDLILKLAYENNQQ